MQTSVTVIVLPLASVVVNVVRGREFSELVSEVTAKVEETGVELVLVKKGAGLAS